MHRSRSSALTAVALCSLLATACGAAPRDEAQDTWTRSYPAAHGARLAIINVNGPIRAEAWDGATLELVAKRSARARSEAAARELLTKIEMREEVGEHGARVEVITPSSFGRSEVEVSWAVRVPRGVGVDLETENGGISLAGLSGEVHAETVNGEIEGAALGAKTLSAESVNGGVEIELTAPLPSDGRIAIESVNGGVSLALPAQSRASVSAEVLNGGIDTDGLALEETGARSRTQLEATLNGGGARVTLETVNGGARLSESRAAEPDAKAESST